MIAPAERGLQDDIGAGDTTGAHLGPALMRCIAAALRAFPLVQAPLQNNKTAPGGLERLPGRVDS